ncbi:VOC family protein [Mycobacterium sp. C3-094]|uniref:VOC family protein n=1 Tax=Mycobacterium sp. PSTR-4-N TaxID=2917745 RepID=UPI001F156800|nr:VOC family protein [Mycobacterium sp. PSTR-4-N]MCG7593090.1 VOC family protein [Mycobacterium sp. PSTR-4-N]
MRIDTLVVADPPSAWTDAGFTVDSGETCHIGGVGIDLVGRDSGSGIVGWSLGELPRHAGHDVDGIPTTRSHTAVPVPVSTVHRNGVTAIDHVVLMSPDLDRTVSALSDLGALPRRERDAWVGERAVRQIFYRFGATIVEVVGSPTTSNPGPSTLWGITFEVTDIDEAARFFGDRTSTVKAAVQPGRRITTLRHHELGLSVRTALISARPPRT